MRQVTSDNSFDKDLKKAKKQNKNLPKLDKIIKLLARGESLSWKYKDHKLKGNWEGYRECHIEPDWLLIYKITENEVRLARTGSHSELF